MSRSDPSAARRPAEHWHVDAGEADVALLDIPPDAQRERRFEVTCAFVVESAGDPAARHGLRVLVDGRQQWSRTVPTHEGGRDSLDVQFASVVPVGVALRITALASAEGGRRVSLTIVAEEQGD